jgi:hypothetical protein
MEKYSRRVSHNRVLGNVVWPKYRRSSGTSYLQNVTKRLETATEFTGYKNAFSHSIYRKLSQLLTCHIKIILLFLMIIYTYCIIISNSMPS